MGFVSGIVVFVILWWLTLLTVLPWGIQNAEQNTLGHDAGAPDNPQLKLKFLITTLITAIIWLAVFGLVQLEVINFFDAAEQMMQEDRL